MFLVIIVYRNVYFGLRCIILIIYRPTTYGRFAIIRTIRIIFCYDNIKIKKIPEFCEIFPNLSRPSPIEPPI